MMRNHHVKLYRYHPAILFQADDGGERVACTEYYLPATFTKDGVVFNLFRGPQVRYKANDKYVVRQAGVTLTKQAPKQAIYVSREFAAVLRRFAAIQSNDYLRFTTLKAIRLGNAKAYQQELGQYLLRLRQQRHTGVTTAQQIEDYHAAWDLCRYADEYNRLVNFPAQTPLLYVPRKGAVSIKRVNHFTVNAYPERYQHQTIAAHIKQYIKTGVAHPRMTESEFLGLLANDLTQIERETLCQQTIDACSNKSNYFGLFNHEVRQRRLNKVSTALTTGKFEVSVEQPICIVPGLHSK